MNIAIVAPSSVPFIVGGAEKFWRGLFTNFVDKTEHFTELIKIPCREGTFWELIDSYQQFSQLDLSHFDLVISTKYPAWMVRHHNHMVYLQHTLRGLYDSYHLTNLPTDISNSDPRIHELVSFLQTAPRKYESIDQLFSILASYKGTELELCPEFSLPSPVCRAVVHFLDSSAMATTEIATYAAISHNVKSRKDYFPTGAQVDVLHHPSDLKNFNCFEGEFIFTTSRLVRCKRVDFIIDAMKYVKEDVSLLIAGDGPELDQLKVQAAEDNRIKFLGYISDDELIDYYSHSIFVPFVPRDEDYGLITIEAMMSSKPVVTVEDAGGVCEFVEDGITGFCTRLNAKEFGQAMDRLASDKELAATMGQNARKRVENITWEKNIKSLLDFNQKTLPSKPEKKIVVTTTFPIYPPISGGQRRIFNLYKELTDSFEVVFITYGNFQGERPKEVKIDHHFKEIRLPWSSEFVELREDLARKTDASIDDVIATKLSDRDHLLLEMLKKETADADLVVASHPYLYPAIESACPEVPIWYDAHNVEYLLKETIIKGFSKADEYLELVRTVEKQCCEKSLFITCCSGEDKNKLSTLYEFDANKCHVVPNGFDNEDIKFVPRVIRDDFKNKLNTSGKVVTLFIGSLHGPNIDAVKLINNFSAKTPNAIYLIAGSVCNAFIGQRLPKRVYLLGEVTEGEKEVLLSSCDIGLNPMQTGSGTNLKLIEYLAAGLDVLTTSFGMRGTEEALEEMLSSCEAAEFASFINSYPAMSSSDEVKSKIREKVELNFSWKSLAQNLPLGEYISKDSEHSA